MNPVLEKRIKSSITDYALCQRSSSSACGSRIIQVFVSSSGLCVIQNYGKGSLCCEGCQGIVENTLSVLMTVCPKWAVLAQLVIPRVFSIPHGYLVAPFMRVVFSSPVCSPSGLAELVHREPPATESNFERACSKALSRVAYIMSSHHAACHKPLSAQNAKKIILSPNPTLHPLPIQKRGILETDPY